MNDPLLERLKGYGSDLEAATEHAAAGASADVPHARARQHRLLPVTVGVACVVAVIAALAATNSTGPRTGATESTPSTTNTAAGQVTAHFEFTSTEVVAGDTLDGWLVIENNTGKNIDTRVDGCAPKWAVRLASASVPPSAMFTADCTIDPTTSTLSTGTTRLPVTATAIYSGCSGGPESATGTTFLPACSTDSDSRIPHLPAGEYEAVFVGVLPGIPTPAPVKITVVEPPAA